MGEVPTANHVYRFYVLRRPHPEAEEHPAPGYSVCVWRPGVFRIVPKSVRGTAFCVWWLFHYCRIFRNRGYFVVVVYHGREAVHRSVVVPGYFRFPFMGPDDLQVGDTWTAPCHRGRGLAQLGLRTAVAAAAQAGGALWYVVAEDNAASIRVVEKAGFQLVSLGQRQSWCGLHLLGRYVMNLNAEAAARGAH